MRTVQLGKVLLLDFTIEPGLNLIQTSTNCVFKNVIHSAGSQFELGAQLGGLLSGKFGRQGFKEPALIVATLEVNGFGLFGQVVEHEQAVV